MSDLIERHMAWMRAGGMSPKTTVPARKRLLGVADNTLPSGLAGATTDHLVAFLDRPHAAQWTRCTYFMHLSGFYRWATENDELPQNPMAKLKRPRPPADMPHPITDDELETALACSNSYWRLIIALAAYAGLRRGDISALRREDVTAETIRIRQGKGHKDAVLPTHPKIWELVEPLPRGRLVDCEPRNLSVSARRHFDRIGMPDVHLHRLRHWHATKLVERGADIRIVQSLMRHSSLATTAKYLEVADNRRRDAIGLL